MSLFTGKRADADVDVDVGGCGDGAETGSAGSLLQDVIVSMQVPSVSSPLSTPTGLILGESVP